VTQVLEGDRRFDLVVRWLPQYRQSLDAIRQIRVSTPAGANIPLSLVSDIRTAEGASFIYREQLARYVPLHFAVRGPALESAIADAKQRVAREVRLPEGVHLEWAGSMAN
jgi:heavy metal efflux system protein